MTTAAAPTDTPPRLRFAIIIDRDRRSHWQKVVVERLLAGGDADLALVIRGHDASVVEARRERSLWRLYNNGVVARRSRCVRGGGTWTDLGVEVGRAVPVLDAHVARRGKWSQHFAAADVERVRAADLDFVFRFGLGIIRGEILDAARLGVWSFHHDDERVVRGGPPSFWEVFDGLPTTGVLLQRLTDRLDGGIPLARATFRSVLHSYPRNRDRVFLGSAGMPAQVARAARLGLIDIPALAPSPSDAPVRHNPSTGEMLRFLTRQSRRAFAVRVERMTNADLWTAGLAGEPTISVDGVDVGAVEWVPELKRGGYLADPFAATRGGRTAILVEEFDEATDRGTISAVERVGREWRLHSSVIDPGVHASYPFLLEDGGELYCVPETWQLGRVELWRAVEFPTRWERAAVLIDDVAVVDPTPVRRAENEWWLFGTVKHDEPDTKLHLWSAKALRGPWLPHPLNPVKIDVSSSRPAGTPFVRDGVLYRPAQDCSTSYGGAVVVNRVRSIGPAGLDEEPAGRLLPPAGRYGSGTHTLSTGDGMWVIDGRRYTRSRHRFVREVRARVRARLPR